jgi:hypothetical protein
MEMLSTKRQINVTLCYLQELKPSAGCVKSTCKLGSNKEAHTPPGCWSYLKKKKKNSITIKQQFLKWQKKNNEQS